MGVQTSTQPLSTRRPDDGQGPGRQPAGEPRQRSPSGTRPGAGPREQPTAHAPRVASGAGPARAGSACGVAGRPLHLCRASCLYRSPATRPVSKSRPRHCGSDGNGAGALGPLSCPGSGPSRRPAAPLWLRGCPSAPSRPRRQAEAAVAARPRPRGTPSLAWTTGRGPPRSPPTGRPAASTRRRAR